MTSLLDIKGSFGIFRSLEYVFMGVFCLPSLQHIEENYLIICISI